MRERISLLVPFRSDRGQRAATWRWLRRYWKQELPDAQIVVGRDHGGKPFSKTNAINDAVRRARGDVFVILDADCYMPGKVITHCAERIRKARTRDVPLWFIPYRSLYRLTEEATQKVLTSHPKDPYRFPSPPNPGDIDDSTGSLYGHKFGALIMIMPREAFELVGCMDPRFRGWGGEDVSFLRALDTLYAQHKNTPNDVLHLWHERKGQKASEQVWEGQDRPKANDWLAVQYNRATKKPLAMRNLVEAGCIIRPQKKLWLWVWHRVNDFFEWVQSVVHRLKVFFLP